MVRTTGGGKLRKIALIVAPIVVFAGLVVLLMRDETPPPQTPVAAVDIIEPQSQGTPGVSQAPPDPQTSLLGTDSSLSTEALELVLVARLLDLRSSSATSRCRPFSVGPMDLRM